MIVTFLNLLFLLVFMGKNKRVLKTSKGTKKLVEAPASDGKVDRQATGIPGFDELVQGGIPRNSLNLLSGSSGTGKTTFGGQFIYNGAVKGEPGIYISLEEEPEQIAQNWEYFGWNVKDLIKQKKLSIVQPELYKYDILLRTIEDEIDRIKAKRVVVDSISLIGMFFQDLFQIRKNILDFNRMLKRLGTTTLAISEIDEGSEKLSTYGVEEYIVDGIIVLHYVRQGNAYTRAVSVRKMRATQHSTKIHPVRITNKGMIAYPNEELFSDLK